LRFAERRLDSVNQSTNAIASVHTGSLLQKTIHSQRTLPIRIKSSHVVRLSSRQASSKLTPVLATNTLCFTIKEIFKRSKQREA
jgi:hypothetical protein